MFTGPPKSLRRREADLRAAGLSKSQARELLRAKPDKYPAAPLANLSYSVVLTYYESDPAESSAGGASESERPDKK